MDYDEFLQHALDDLNHLVSLEKDERKRWWMVNIISDIEEGKVRADELVEELKMIHLRNPAFDGDMVGWLDDDFDEDDTDDDD
jgi:hypothetical protein